MNPQHEQHNRQPTFTHFRSWLVPPGLWIWRHPPKPPDNYQNVNRKLRKTETNIKQDQQRSQTMLKKHSLRSGPLFGIIAVALIWVASAATPANALVAAGTQISNQATVSFAEGADVTSLAVVTTVNLVAASPTLTFVEFASTPGSTAAISSTETTAVGVNYRLVSNSNGPDTYEFVPAPSSVDVDRLLHRKGFLYKLWKYVLCSLCE